MTTGRINQVARLRAEQARARGPRIESSLSPRTTQLTRHALLSRSSRTDNTLLSAAGICICERCVACVRVHRTSGGAQFRQTNKQPRARSSRGCCCCWAKRKLDAWKRATARAPPRSNTHASSGTSARHVKRTLLATLESNGLR